MTVKQRITQKKVTMCENEITRIFLKVINNGLKEKLQNNKIVNCPSSHII